MSNVATQGKKAHEGFRQESWCAFFAFSQGQQAELHRAERQGHLLRQA
jgi:hypothetical protein